MLGDATNIEADIVKELLEWQNIGGQQTIDEFHKLTKEEQRDIIEYLEAFSLYKEVKVNEKIYVIVHAGLDNFSKERKHEDYELFELLFKSPYYDEIYFSDKYLITGHLPTRVIESNPKPDHIYIANNQITIDCGAGFGGQIGAICLETGEQFYSKE